jgi:hypothetical protein
MNEFVPYFTGEMQCTNEAASDAFPVFCGRKTISRLPI